MTERERPNQRELDRQLEELLGENRVALPSVVVLFAFLLTLPFRSGFETATAVDRAAYFAAFMTSALAMILLVAQSAYHRIVGRPYDKALMLRTASRQAITAIALLAISMASVIFLVSDIVYPGGVAFPLAAAVLAFALVMWFALPLTRRLRRNR